MKNDTCQFLKIFFLLCNPIGRNVAPEMVAGDLRVPRQPVSLGRPYLLLHRYLILYHANIYIASIPSHTFLSRIFHLCHHDDE